MSDWKVAGPPRFVEGVGMVYPVTKGGSRFNAAEEDELKALLAGWISISSIDDISIVGEEILVWDGCECHIDHVDVEIEYGTAYMANGTEPTHWKPLPAPPTN